MVLWTRRECEVHEMSDGGTPFATIGGLHGRLVCNMVSRTSWHVAAILDLDLRTQQQRPRPQV